MTKEEIIEDTWNKYPDEDTISRRTFFEAMDIYAKQQAIEFAEWAVNGNWVSNEDTYNYFLQSKQQK